MYKKRELNVNKRKPQDMKKTLQPDPMTTCTNASALIAFQVSRPHTSSYFKTLSNVPRSSILLAPELL
jgi:hypothetical protein